MPAAFKTVAVVGKSDAASLPSVLDQVAVVLRRNGIAVLMEESTAQASGQRPDGTFTLDAFAADVDLTIVVGGDGTLLHCARLMADRGVPLVGVNLGRLGFLTDIPARELISAIEALLHGQYTREERLLLAGEVHRSKRKLFSTVAMNDVVVSRGAMGSMIEFAVTVDGEFIYTLRADGLIVASPTGSTAYALSAGGPILHPALSAIALVPISPHTLSNRPVAVRATSQVEITLVRGADARANFDVQSHFALEPGDVVAVTSSAKPAILLHPPGYRYFAMLREKLRWNERTT